MNQTIVESFHSGHCLEAYKVFGAHFDYEEENGVRFTVWAPHALSVEIIGDFNNWNGISHNMNKISDNGIWSLFVPNLEAGCIYKYRIYDFHGNVNDKADPFAFYSELRPANASVVWDLDKYKWKDNKWVNNRTKNFDEPVNIYEVHAGSWKKNGIYWLNYLELKDSLIPYVLEKGFTHIELMPLNEHPFDGSWGYQANGYFSVTSRYGKPEEFMEFVEACHDAGIGVIMDMVPVHFVKDTFGLRYFDGEPLYEYLNPNDANSEWGTMNFDLWKEEVRSFLMSAASFWCDYYHIDGIRMDAISHLIYWGGNSDRGVNEGAIAFVKRLNYHLSTKYKGVMLIAEDSSAYPKVTKSTIDQGLGFDYKWDLGWMNDTLKYYKLDPVYRKYHHNYLTFSMAYFYSENFLLPLSHDEVVHGKQTIIDRMWGDYDQKFAQAKNLYVYMYTHPGKKLNFMGNEIGMFREWDEDRECDWFLLDYSRHNSFSRFFEDISRIYRYNSIYSKQDYSYDSFKWIDADNADQSVFSFYREDNEKYCVTCLNMTPCSYDNFSIGVPQTGKYTEIMNTEKDIYEGCNLCNYEPIKTHKGKLNGFDQTLTFKLAPFAAIIFEVKKTKPRNKKTTKEVKKVKKEAK